MNGVGFVFGGLSVILIVAAYWIQIRRRKHGLPTRNAYEWLNALLSGRKENHESMNGITKEAPPKE